MILIIKIDHKILKMILKDKLIIRRKQRFVKKKNENKNESSELKNLIEQLKEFKNKIEVEPGMKNYEENTDLKKN